MPLRLGELFPKCNSLLGSGGIRQTKIVLQVSSADRIVLRYKNCVTSKNMIDHVSNTKRKPQVLLCNVVQTAGVFVVFLIKPAFGGTGTTNQPVVLFRGRCGRFGAMEIQSECRTDTLNFQTY